MSKAFLVSCDLYAWDVDYSALATAVECVGTSALCIARATWIVSSALNATQIRDRLSPLLTGNDRLFVNSIGQETAWAGFSAEGSHWLKGVL